MSNVVGRAKQALAFATDFAADELFSVGNWLNAQRAYNDAVADAEEAMAKKSGWTSFFRKAAMVVAAIALAPATGGISLVQVAGTLAAGYVAGKVVDEAHGDIKMEEPPGPENFRRKYKAAQNTQQYGELTSAYDQGQDSLDMAEAQLEASHFSDTLDTGIKLFGAKLMSLGVANATAADFSSVTADVGAEGISVPVNITDQGTFVDPSANMDFIMAPGDMSVPTGETMGLGDPIVPTMDKVIVTPDSNLDTLGDTSWHTSGAEYAEAKDVIDNMYSEQLSGAEPFEPIKFYSIEQGARDYQTVVESYTTDDYYDTLIDELTDIGVG
jgi:hypothetical protein